RTGKLSISGSPGEPGRAGKENKMSYRLRTRIVLLAIVLLGFAGPALARGVGVAESSESAQTQQSGHMMDMERSCPMMVDDVSVDVADTANGVALTFTTGSGDVGGLRSRVRHLAEMYGEHHGMGAMQWHPMGGHGQHLGMTGEERRHGGMHGEMHHGSGKEMSHGMMPAATATVEEVEDGARLLLVPADASDLDSLRQHVRMHCEKMKAGNCPMMQPKS
ncbi:MAG TPA: hypothetical protein VLV83_17780, partial [Acidobacteriota bacterium]|nr:hypothetical protein [Acidobacteriota bacterium]